jgi:DNA polymerase-3 subunit beta
MQFEITREALIKPLQVVTGVVERRLTLPVLSNVMLVLEKNMLSMTGTDLEVELVGRVEVVGGKPGEITVPARKLMDICKALPDDATIKFELDDNKALLRQGRSRFSLSTLPAGDFPVVEESPSDLNFSMSQKVLKQMLDSTSFAMAQQDVRYYLNGLLLELAADYVRVVATDGHRLAMNTHKMATGAKGKTQVIIPRKGILELGRLLDDGDAEVSITLGPNNVRASTEQFTFTSKLVDGKFPDYDRVLPKGGDKELKADRQMLRQAFGRAAILSNEKFRGIRMSMGNNELKVQANNPEQEEAEEIVNVDYAAEAMEIGFNVSYLMDVLSVLPSEKVLFTLSDSNSSALIQADENSSALYVVMPMRL